MKNANLVSSVCRLLFVLVALTGVNGCRQGTGVEKPVDPAGEFKPVTEFFPVKVGGKTVSMQIAALPSEMQHGLMGRRDLGVNQGMIFIFKNPTRMSFFMRNTPTALDIGFFSADGVLQEIYPMYPFDETTVASRGGRLQFALEMNQGWYTENGVKAGSQLEMAALVAAMKARGFELRAFGLGALEPVAKQ